MEPLRPRERGFPPVCLFTMNALLVHAGAQPGAVPPSNINDLFGGRHFARFRLAYRVALSYDVRDQVESGNSERNGHAILPHDCTRGR